MKKKSVLISLCMVILLPLIHAQNIPAMPDPNSGHSKITIQNIPHDPHRGFKEVLSEKWNDSIIWYNWNSVLSGWDIDVREFRIRSLYGYVSSRLYLKLDTTTHEWKNMWLDEMDYFGSTGDLKTTSNKTWDAVSSSWILYYYYHYASPGNEDEYYYKNWDPVSQKFDYGYRYTYQYDLIGNQTEKMDFELDTVTGLWVNISKTSSTYSLAGITEQISMNWDTATSIWVNSEKMEYTYDASNFLTEIKRYSWNLTDWTLNSHSLFTNNSAGYPTQRLDEYWTGGAWSSYYKTGYTYDAAETRLLNKLEQSYNFMTLTWTNSRNQTNTYFPSGFTNSSLFELWNSVSGSWMDWEFDEYDASGNHIESYYKSINTYTFEILYGYRYLDTYDVNNRFLQEIQQTFDPPSGVWIDHSKYQSSYEDPVNNYYVEGLTTLWNGTSWVNDSKDVYYWSYPSGTGNLSGHSRLCFYENPMAEGKPINCPFLDPAKEYQFDLFSVKGENVYSEPVIGSSSFTIQRSLPAGSYILRISEKGRTVYRDKIVVIK